MRRRRAAGLAGSRDRLEGFLDLLWGAFSGSLFCAVLELQVAARTDPELREPLREFERQAGRAILEMWRVAARARAEALGEPEVREQVVGRRGRAPARYARGQRGEGDELIGQVAVDAGAAG
jgi:hypothetical protein